MMNTLGSVYFYLISFDRSLHTLFQIKNATWCGCSTKRSIRKYPEIRLCSRTIFFIYFFIYFFYLCFTGFEIKLNLNSTSYVFLSFFWKTCKCPCVCIYKLSHSTRNCHNNIEMNTRKQAREKRKTIERTKVQRKKITRKTILTTSKHSVS